MPEDWPPPVSDHFLVCGLGSLGQHCVAILHQFGVKVSAIEQTEPIAWELPQVQDCLEMLWIGDCRLVETLQNANVQSCRTVLLVTSDEQVNLEAAFAARVVNSQVRLVVRSAKQNFNHLLSQHLGNFVAFEPTQLSAPAFALAALCSSSPCHIDSNTDEQILGLFQIESDLWQITQKTIKAGDRWCNVPSISELNTRSRGILYHATHIGHPQSKQHTLFHQWHPNAKISPGDTIITVTVSRKPDVLLSRKSDSLARSFFPAFHKLVKTGPIQLFRQWWLNSAQHPLQRLVVLCLFTVLILWGLGTVLFSLYYPAIRLQDAFHATAIMLLGGYGDLFSDFQLTGQLPWWLRLFGLSLTLAGTAFIGVLYALLTEKLLTWRLQFAPTRPPVPEQDHVIVVGLGRVGQRVVQLLESLHRPLVGITDQPLAADVLPQMPLVVGPFTQALGQANLEGANSIVAVTEDEMANLEMSLIAHNTNPDCGLAIRTYDRRFTVKVAHLFPYAQVLCASELSAEAFAAAAFGEDVLGLFRLMGQTVLVTDYRVEANDTLNTLLIAEVAYGYGVVPIYFQRATQDRPSLMPSDDLQLRAGDQLVVLATSAGLQRIESGQLAARTWQVTLEQAWSDQALFNGATEIARVTGCSLTTAQELMQNLPMTLPMKLYRNQALRLEKRLSRVPVRAQIQPIMDP